MKMQKNILVIGLGSMGKRRIRLLSERNDVQICGVDSQESRRKEVEEKYALHTFESIELAMNNHQFDCAFVCTSPLSHSTIIKKCLLNYLHVFTELNLVSDGYDDNMKIAKDNGLVLFLSSTLCYRQEMNYIIDAVQHTEGKLNYNYHVGQYLPDWHPWESYNNYFIGDKRTNGCREIMAIDLPWLVSAFGKIKNVLTLKSKDTTLNISYNDNYLMLIEHESGTKGVFAVDVVSRKAVRKFELYGENIYLTWNGTPDSLKLYNIADKQETSINFENASEHIDGYASFVSETPYREEINAFFDEINGKKVARWDIEKDKHILQVIDQIEA